MGCCRASVYQVGLSFAEVTAVATNAYGRSRAELFVYPGLSAACDEQFGPELTAEGLPSV